ncbi:MAG: tetratricopeptide repeat protein [Candidatus Rokubacteria bacterium]|nr:tetratricopeptide repeat protein [Candidatus Rokubacteria bacterium]
MPIRLGLLLALAFGAFVAYLAAVNPGHIRVAVGPNLAYDLPLMVLVVGAFFAGASLSLLVMLLRDVRRSVREYRPARAVRRAEGTGELFQREPEPRLASLRATRDLTASTGSWADALEVQERLVSLAGEGERSAELGWLAGIHYELGKAALAGARFAEARRHFTEALKADRAFLPAYVALGDAWEQSGDQREAFRTWKRAAEEVAPAPVLLRRIEQVYRAEGRPTQMIALYRDALARAPHELALAFSLGRVYFELEMLDEAADQFQKVEVQAPDLAPLHAFLGAIYERRGQPADAFEEYRRALRLARGFDWPHRCSACGAEHTGWQDRCPRCGRWNTSKG